MRKPVFTLGTIQGRYPEYLRATLDMLSRHMVIYGGTGGGKTTAALMLMQQLASAGVGFTYVTPHPDGRLKFLEWAVVNRIKPSRIVDLCAGSDCCLSVDPWAHMPRGLNALQEESWLRATNTRIVSSMLSNVPVADQEVMNQLHRWLSNDLYCCGKRVGGEYLGFGKALMLLNPEDDEFEPAMDRLWPHLPEDVRFDYQVFRSVKNVNQRQAMVNSTVNRLRRTAFSNPQVTQMLARRANAVNDEEIINNSMIQLVSVPETDELPREAGNTIGRMRISSIMAASRRIAARVPEHRRKYHAIFVDEGECFLSEDLNSGFPQARKFKTPIVLIIQDISCAQKGEMNLLPKIASQCGVQGTFQQQDPDSLEYLSKVYAYPTLDLTPLIVNAVEPDGFDWEEVVSRGYSRSEGESRSQSKSVTRTHSETRQTHTGWSVNQSVSEALSESHTEGESRSHGTGGSEGTSIGSNWSEGESRSLQLSRSLGESSSRQDSENWGTSQSDQWSSGHALGTSKNRSVSGGESESESHTLSHSLALSSTRSESSNTSTTNQTSSSQSSGTSDGETSGSSDSRSTGDGRSGPMGKFATSENHSVGKGHTENRGTSSNRTESSSTSNSTSTSTNEGSSVSEGETVTNGESFGTTKSRSSGWNEGTGESETNSTGHAHGLSSSRGGGASVGVSESETFGVGVGATASTGVGGSEGRSEQKSWTDSLGQTISDGTGRTLTESSGTGESGGESKGFSDGESLGDTTGLSLSESKGKTVTYSKTPLPRHKITPKPSGKLVVSVPDQIAGFIRLIARLRDRTMLMKVKGVDFPFVLSVHEARDPYARLKVKKCEAWRDFDLKRYVALIRKAHPYYFLPTLDREEKAVPAKPEKPRARRVAEMEDSMS